MNIAFSTILVFLFLLPGLAFRRLYFTGEFSKEYFRSSGFEIFFLAIIPAIIFHTLGYNLTPYILPLKIDLWILHLHIPKLGIDMERIGMLLIGKGSEVYVQESFSKIAKHYNYIVSYNIGITIIAGASGFIVKALIRNLKLDRWIKILRFQNEWHYILSSEILEFPKVKRKSPYNRSGKTLSAVWVDALVDLGEKEGGTLYSGILEDYKLSKDGGLELIYLTHAYRRFIEDDPLADSTDQNTRSTFSLFGKKENEDPYYYMPEHYFILKYEEIKNLNVFYEFEKKEPLLDWESVLGLGVLLGFFFGFWWLTSSWVAGVIITVLITLLILRYASDEEKEKEDSSKS